MPDLATHLAAAWLAGRSAGLFRPVRSATDLRPGGRAVYLFTAGSAIPDLLARAPHLTLESSWLEYATRPLHAPAGLLLVCLAASFLFEERERGKTFSLLLGGAMLHCLLDLFQTVGPSSSYSWLYPLSEVSPQVGLFSGDGTVAALPFVLGSAVLLELAHRLARGRLRGR